MLALRQDGRTDPAMTELDVVQHTEGRRAAKAHSDAQWALEGGKAVNLC